MLQHKPSGLIWLFIKKKKNKIKKTLPCALTVEEIGKMLFHLLYFLYLLLFLSSLLLYLPISLYLKAFFTTLPNLCFILSSPLKKIHSDCEGISLPTARDTYRRSEANMKWDGRIWINYVSNGYDEYNKIKKKRDFFKLLILICELLFFTKAPFY